MRHLALPRFWHRYRRLPQDVRKLADKSYQLLKDDPFHPSLHFKKVGRTRQLWSVRVGELPRARGREAGGHRLVLDRDPR